MQQHAFIMKVKPGCEDLYRRRHDAIWPELEQELRAAGIVDYAIFFDEDTHTLFAFQRLKDEHTAGQLPESPVIRRWWAHMADVIETEPDNTPVCRALREVYRMGARTGEPAK